MMYTMYMRMVRKQLYIEERQDRFLKRRAKKLGISEAEVVRAALDAALAKEHAPQQPPPSLPGEDPLEQLFKLADEDVKRHKLPLEGWSREELYAEREDRLVSRLDRSAHSRGGQRESRRITEPAVTRGQRT